MKVFDLGCSQGHRFEGWFASEDDYRNQESRGLVECPLCGDRGVSRLPSAPRLNLASPAEPAAPDAMPTAMPAPDARAMWLKAVRHIVENTEDVGRRFAEEARRIHYGEVEARGIRGQATAAERAELAEEGVEVMPLPIPAGMLGGALN